MWNFIEAHHTALALLAAWTYSALCSSMPPMPDKAGFMLTWLHNFLQATAANINKIKHQEG